MTFKTGSKQISSEIGKFLNKPVADIDLKECLEIDRYAKNNQLNGICHAPKEGNRQDTSGSTMSFKFMINDR